MKHTKKEFETMIKANSAMFYEPMPEWAKELYPVITLNVLKSFGFSATIDHNGKMCGMQSLSTSCISNPICRKRIENAYKKVMPDFSLDTATNEQIKEARAGLKKLLAENPYRTDISICGLCFSYEQQNVFTSMTDPLTKNADILNNGIIHPDYIPFINALYFRFESFGDFASVNAAINAIHFAERNPQTTFGTWSKNMRFFKKAYETIQKPKNIVMIKSSQYINKPVSITKTETFIDKTFTVYMPEYAKKHNIRINCGARACMTCLKCYKAGNTENINELLK